MDRASARELLDTLAEETDQLRDPAALQFAGGTTEATRAAEDALSEQLRGVDQLRAGLTAALPGAVTDGIVEDYRAAVAEALDRVRRGRAPEQAPVEHRTAPAVASSGTPDRGTGAAPAPTAEPDPPAPRRPPLALVVPVVLVVAVVLAVALAALLA